MKFADLHNHTKRCNHAVGECRDYIEAAIANKIDIFGFSCHSPMKFDEAYRMALSEVDDYLGEILALRDEYSDRIDIKVGFEVDYIDKKPQLLEAKVLNAKVDFLVGSVHFLDDFSFDNPAFIGEYKHKDLDILWQEYLQAIANMAQSGLFDIVGHFDLLKIFNNPPRKNAQNAIKNALESIKDNDLVLEINAAGLDKQICEIYPSSEILSLAFKMEIPISFASDAHAPQKVGIYKDKMLDFALKTGYKSAVSFSQRQRETISLI